MAEELKLPLYVEIDDNYDESEFMEVEQDGKQERLRKWAIIPKRLVANVRTSTVKTPDGKQLKVAKIGNIKFHSFDFVILINFFQR